MSSGKGLGLRSAWVFPQNAHSSCGLSQFMGRDVTDAGPALFADWYFGAEYQLNFNGATLIYIQGEDSYSDVPFRDLEVAAGLECTFRPNIEFEPAGGQKDVIFSTDSGDVSADEYEAPPWPQIDVLGLNGDGWITSENELGWPGTSPWWVCNATVMFRPNAGTNHVLLYAEDALLVWANATTGDVWVKVADDSPVQFEDALNPDPDGITTVNVVAQVFDDNTYNLSFYSYVGYYGSSIVVSSDSSQSKTIGGTVAESPIVIGHDGTNGLDGDLYWVQMSIGTIGDFRGAQYVITTEIADAGTFEDTSGSDNDGVLHLGTGTWGEGDDPLYSPDPAPSPPSIAVFRDKFRRLHLVIGDVHEVFTDASPYGVTFTVKLLWDGEDYSFYINDVLESSGSYNHLSVGPEPIVWGCGYSNGDLLSFSGTIRDIKFLDASGDVVVHCPVTDGADAFPAWEEDDYYDYLQCYDGSGNALDFGDDIYGTASSLNFDPPWDGTWSAVAGDNPEILGSMFPTAPKAVQSLEGELEDTEILGDMVSTAPAGLQHFEGSVIVSATQASLAPKHVQAVSGEVEVAGNLSALAPKHVQSLSGGVLIEGDLIQDSQSGTQTLAGSTIVQGDIVQSAESHAQSMSGSALVQGDAFPSAPNAVQSMAGSVEVAGSQATLAPKHVQSLGGSVDIAGTMFPMAPKAVQSMGGGVEVAGSQSSVAPVTLSAVAGVVEIAGDLTSVAPKAIQHMEGEIDYPDGSVFSLAPQHVQSLAGSVEITGSLMSVAPKAIGTLSGQVISQGHIMMQPAGKPSQEMDGLALIHGDAVSIAKPPLQVLAGETLIQGAATPVAPRAVQSLNGGVSISGSVNAQSPKAVQEMSASVHVQGALVQASPKAANAMIGHSLVSGALIQTAAPSVYVSSGIVLVAGSVFNIAPKARHALTGMVFIEGAILQTSVRHSQSYFGEVDMPDGDLYSLAPKAIQVLAGSVSIVGTLWSMAPKSIQVMVGGRVRGIYRRSAAQKIKSTSITRGGNMIETDGLRRNPNTVDADALKRKGQA